MELTVEQMTRNRIDAYRRVASGEFNIHRWGVADEDRVMHEVSCAIDELPEQKTMEAYQLLGETLGIKIEYMGTLGVEEASQIADTLEASLV